MKAIAYESYGAPEDVLSLVEAPEPTLGRDRVLVRVRASSVNPIDWHLMRADPRIIRLQMGLRRPKVGRLGYDLAGTVEAVGEGVTAFELGDEVFGSPDARDSGGLAERCAIPEERLELKPADLSMEEAATVPLAGLTALQALRDAGRLESGQSVLIIGAGGGVGTLAVQISKALGAEVTGVCSTSKVELVRSLGADEVVDYTREDLTEGDRRWDLIVQLAGTARPGVLRRALTRDGTLVVSSGESAGAGNGPIGRVMKARLLSAFVGQRLVTFTAKPNKPDLSFLRELIEDAKLAPVIDRIYPLNQVADAISYLEEGHARGKIAIAVGTGPR